MSLSVIEAMRGAARGLRSAGPRVAERDLISKGERLKRATVPVRCNRAGRDRVLLAPAQEVVIREQHLITTIGANAGTDRSFQEIGADRRIFRRVVVPFLKVGSPIAMALIIWPAMAKWFAFL